MGGGRVLVEQLDGGGRGPNECARLVLVADAVVGGGLEGGGLLTECKMVRMACRGCSHGFDIAHFDVAFPA